MTDPEVEPLANELRAEADRLAGGATLPLMLAIVFAVMIVAAWGGQITAGIVGLTIAFVGSAIMAVSSLLARKHLVALSKDVGGRRGNDPSVPFDN